MESEIRRILGTFGATAPTAQKKDGAIYEAWILLRIAEGLRAAPFLAQLCDAKGIALTGGNPFVLKGGPGKLGTGQACMVRFNWSGVRHELHANVRYRGRSSETHEIDISVVPESVATQLRNAGGGFPTGFPRVAIECKHRNSVGQKDEARQVVARLFDLHFLNSHPFPISGQKHHIWPDAAYGMGYGETASSYKASFDRCFNGLCRFGGVTPGAARFLSFNNVTTLTQLRVGAAASVDVVNEVVNFLSRQRP